MILVMVLAYNDKSADESCRDRVGRGHNLRDEARSKTNDDYESNKLHGSHDGKCKAQSPKSGRCCHFSEGRRCIEL